MAMFSVKVIGNALPGRIGKPHSAEVGSLLELAERLEYARMTLAGFVSERVLAVQGEPAEVGEVEVAVGRQARGRIGAAVERQARLQAQVDLRPGGQREGQIEANLLPHGLEGDLHPVEPRGLDLEARQELDDPADDVLPGHREQVEGQPFGQGRAVDREGNGLPE